jgi:hypothetical protein
VKTPHLVALAAVTAVAAIAAGISVYGRAPSSLRAQAGGGEAVFAGLAGKADDIAQIVVTRSGGNGFTLAKKGEGWTLADRGDFPVRAEQAKKAAEALADLKLMEPKTARASLLSRLDVDDPAAETSKAVLVTLKNAQGAELGRVILGKPRPDSLENPRSGVYARRPNDARAWLAEGDPKIAPAPADWVDRTVLTFKTEQVRRVATQGADGARLEIARQKQEDKDFKIAGLPADTKIKNQAGVNELANTLDALLLDDVRAAGGVQFPAAADRAEFARFDGLVVRLTLAKVKDDVWVKLAAAAEPWIKTEDGKSAPVEPGADAKKEAAELNARLGAFAFKLTESSAKKLTTRLGDLAEKEEKKN